MDANSANPPAFLWINYDTLWFPAPQRDIMIGASGNNPDRQQRPQVTHRLYSNTPSAATKTRWLPRDNQTGEKRRWIPPRHKMDNKNVPRIDAVRDSRVHSVEWCSKSNSGRYSGVNNSTPGFTHGVRDYETRSSSAECVNRNRNDSAVYNKHSLHPISDRQPGRCPPPYRERRTGQEYVVGMNDRSTNNDNSYSMPKHAQYGCRDTDQTYPQRTERQSPHDRWINGTNNIGNIYVRNYEDCEIVPGHANKNNEYRQDRPSSGEHLSSSKQDTRAYSHRNRRNNLQPESMSEHAMNRPAYLEHAWGKAESRDLTGDQPLYQSTGKAHFDDTLLSNKSDYGRGMSENLTRNIPLERNTLVDANTIKNEDIGDIGPPKSPPRVLKENPESYSTSNRNTKFNPPRAQDAFDQGQENTCSRPVKRHLENPPGCKKPESSQTPRTSIPTDYRTSAHDIDKTQLNIASQSPPRNKRETLSNFTPKKTRLHQDNILRNKDRTELSTINGQLDYRTESDVGIRCLDKYDHSVNKDPETRPYSDKAVTKQTDRQLVINIDRSLNYIQLPVDNPAKFIKSELDNSEGRNSPSEQVQLMSNTIPPTYSNNEPDHVPDVPSYVNIHIVHNYTYTKNTPSSPSHTPNKHRVREANEPNDSQDDRRRDQDEEVSAVIPNAETNSCNSDHIPHHEDAAPQEVNSSSTNTYQREQEEDNVRGCGRLNTTENDAEIARCLHESLESEREQSAIDTTQVPVAVESSRAGAIRGLTPIELSVLTSSKLEKVPVTTKCEICWEPYKIGDSVRYLMCAHFFHLACIDRWLKRTATCPVCRTVLVDLFLPDISITATARPRRRRCIIL